MAVNPTALAQLLVGESSRLRELLDLLNREQQALAMVNADELEEIAPTKSQLLDDIAHAVWARDSLLDANGLPAGDDGIRRAQALDPTLEAACEPLWTDITALVLECQEINRVNGAILHQLASRTSSLIASLFGEAAPTSPYGRA
jgi:flagellar biosynthesis/type III secretory pathway chaperone